MIPVVDIGVYLQTVERCGGQGVVGVLQTQPEVKETARQVHEAICEHGFCYLSNHGLPAYVLDRALSSSKQFFELDQGVKGKYARGQTDCHGWMPLEKESLNPDRTHGDLKESFNYTPSEEKELPPEVPDLDQSFKDMFQVCHVLCASILDLLGVALELEDPSVLNKAHQQCGKKGSYSTLRSVYYPPGTLKEGQAHSGEHSSYGSITLLFLDHASGVQVKGRDGEHRDINSEPGAVLLNVGDMLQRWTADKYPAAVHRVVMPPEAATQGAPRQTLIFYYYPDDQAVIQCLDGSDTYPPVTPKEYLMSKFSNTAK